MSFNWTCPFCQRDQVVVDENFRSSHKKLYLDHNSYQDVGYRILAICCANKACKEIALTLFFGAGQNQGGQWTMDAKSREAYQIRPASSEKPQPASVPSHIAQDYYEACRIRDLSPKASATLSRRALQAMIHDFCNVQKRTLWDEIEELNTLFASGEAPDAVTAETIQAMHHVRELGNIGAHMTKATDVIVDVDPDEAQTMIHLIEMLFAEWYIAQASRQQTLDKLKASAASKKQSLSSS